MNCEVRRFEFEAGLGEEDDEGEDEARIVETLESRRARGLEGPMKIWEEQGTLFEEAMAEWERSGLQRPDRIGEEGYVWKSGVGLGREMEDGEEGAVNAQPKGPGERQVESAEVGREEVVEREALEQGRGVKVQA